MSTQPKVRIRSIALVLGISIVVSVASSLVATSLMAAKKSDRSPNALVKPYILIRVKRLMLPETSFRRVSIDTAVNYLDENSIHKQVLSLDNSPDQPRAVEVALDERFRDDALLALSRENVGNRRALDVNLSVHFDGLSNDLPDEFQVKDSIQVHDLKLNEPVTRAYLMKAGGANQLKTKLVVEYVRKY